MALRSTVFALAIACLNTQTVQAQVPRVSELPLHISDKEGGDLIGRIVAAQEKVRTGGGYFKLLAGSIAARPMPANSPREALLSLDFGKSDELRRLQDINGALRHYWLIFHRPQGMRWKVDVFTSVYGGEIESIELMYEPELPS